MPSRAVPPWRLVGLIFSLRDRPVRADGLHTYPLGSGPLAPWAWAAMEAAAAVIPLIMLVKLLVAVK